MEQWGISGPRFVVLYAIAVVVAIIATVLARKWVRNVNVPGAQSRMTVEEVAWLLGGPDRVIDATIAGLVERNALRLRRGGQLRHVAGAVPSTELETLILTEAQRLGACTTRQLRDRLREHRLLGAAEESLVRRGLMMPPGYRRVLLAAAPLLVVEAIGIARLISGVLFTRPVGALVVLVIVATCATGLALHRPAPWPTRAGVKIRSSMSRRRGKTHDQRVPRLQLTGAAALVAVGGLVAFPDNTIAKALRSSRESDSSDDSACSSCGSSSCSSTSSSDSTTSSSDSGTSSCSS